MREPLTVADPAILEIIRLNLQAIQQQVDDACRRAKRDPSQVKLVAVTKYAEWPWVEAISQLVDTFGENRPQQLAERQPLMPHISWHLIGQLQRNKAKLALQHASMIHSVDSLRLLQRLAELAAEMNLRPSVLLQVNVTGETSKSGFTPEELTASLDSVVNYAQRVQVDGLMTMARDSDDPEDARPAFTTLRDLRDQLAARSDSLAAHMTLPQLSMGMSGDFVQAVEEGATLIRIGSRLFEGLAE